jgi:hypothetical protein
MHENIDLVSDISSGRRKYRKNENNTQHSQMNLFLSIYSIRYDMDFMCSILIAGHS